jgi:hypothetical protein
MGSEILASRTLPLDPVIQANLRSPLYEDWVSAFLALPEALTPREVDDVGIESWAEDIKSKRQAEKVRRETVFKLGLFALSYKGDIVTARSAAAVLLRSQRVDGLAASFVLRGSIRRKEKRLFRQISNDLDELTSLDS